MKARRRVLDAHDSTPTIRTNLPCSGTWYDVDAHIRIMWRTTVRGNPDPAYAGETHSWVPAKDFKPS